LDTRNDVAESPAPWRFQRAGEDILSSSTIPPAVPGDRGDGRPSARRFEEERRRRHRERAIAAWLRDLSR
jgi:hypothetical protein